MSEEPKDPPPASVVKIDPYPILADILNHFERMVISQAAIIDRLVHVIRENNVPGAGNLEELYQNAASTHQAYWTFKGEMLQRAEEEAKNGQQ